MENAVGVEPISVQSPVSVVLSLLGGLLLFALVLLLAWLCTRWLGGYYRAKNAPGGSFQLLERMTIGPDRSLMAVRLKGRVWVLGVTPQNITFLGELSPEDYPEDTPAEPQGGMDFTTAFQDAVKKWGPGKKQGEQGNKDE